MLNEQYRKIFQNIVPGENVEDCAFLIALTALLESETIEGASIKSLARSARVHRTTRKLNRFLVYAKNKRRFYIDEIFLLDNIDSDESSKEIENKIRDIQALRKLNNHIELLAYGEIFDHSFYPALPRNMLRRIKNQRYNANEIIHQRYQGEVIRLIANIPDLTGLFSQNYPQIHAIATEFIGMTQK